MPNEIEGRTGGRIPGIPLISIVEDDDSFRSSLNNLLTSAGFEPRGFSSAEAFLNSSEAPRTACLIVDVGLPGMDGLELQRRVLSANWRIPMIFMTARKDEAWRAQALSAGALDFLYKPLEADALLRAVDRALRI